MPFQPKIALSCATVAPASAARVAAILRQPWADRLRSPADTHASLNAFPNDCLVNGFPDLPQMKASSPVGPASRVRWRTGKIGIATVTPPWLFSVRRVGYTVTDMLATELDRVAAPDAGIEQYIAPDTFLSADRPAPVVVGRVFLCPNREAGALLSLGILNADGGIDGDVPRLYRPFEEAAHRIEEIARLCWRGGTPIPSGRDSTGCDSSDLLVSRRLGDLLEMILAISARRE